MTFKVARRSVLRAVAGLPLLGGLGRLFLFGGSAIDKTAPQSFANRRAVNVLRLFNTLEAKYQSVHGRYATIDQLAMSSNLITDVMEQAGIGHSLHSSLHFDAKEIIQGWRLGLRLTRDPDGYVAIMDGSATGLGAFSTDQKGVIVRGEPTSLDIAMATSASSLVAGLPLGSRGAVKLSRTESIFRALTFGPETAEAGPMTSCTNTCCPGGLNWGCYTAPVCNYHNCGCGNCPWCCYTANCARPEN